ncbi:MAG: hypothetical protein ACRDN0_22205 [Trebonia sp.]
MNSRNGSLRITVLADHPAFGAMSADVPAQSHGRGLLIEDLREDGTELRAGICWSDNQAAGRSAQAV